MSFQPVVPFGGIVGLQYLQRTMDRQREAFDASPVLQRDVDYFRERIGAITTAEDLVADRRLLTVALGAFGLDDDLDNRFLIRKVLEEGTQDPRALANRLTDRRYAALSEAFGFGTGTLPNTARTGFADRIASDFLERRFEIGVGETDTTLRLALELERELPALAARPSSDATKWLTVLGNRPMRQVFETAFGLPPAFATLDLDRQQAVFRDRSERLFGVSSFSDFAEADTLEKLTRTFLARAQLAEGAGAGASAASTALTLLSQAAPPNLLSTL